MHAFFAQTSRCSSVTTRHVLFTCFVADLLFIFLLTVTAERSYLEW